MVRMRPNLASAEQRASPRFPSHASSRDPRVDLTPARRAGAAQVRFTYEG